MRSHIIALLLFIGTSLAYTPSANGASQQDDAEFARAMLQLAEGREPEFRKQILALCESGHTNAQVAFGRFLIAKREYAAAESWLTKAASTHSADGQYALGFLYFQVSPQRTAEARSWMEKASKQGHARASAVLQLFSKKSRVGPSGQLSVLDILEGAAVVGRLRTEALLPREVQCTGHKPEAMEAVFDSSSTLCIKEVHGAFGDWVSPEKSKEVGVLWGQCVNREILKPTGIPYAEYLRCRWSPAP